MKTKTFKIGEYAKGGIITVEIKGKTIAVIGKDWDMSKGTRRSSDQSGAKEWTRLEVQSDAQNAHRELDFFLCDLTTSYYAGEIIKWIETKIELKPEFGY
jgi:hypothetical protein